MTANNKREYTHYWGEMRVYLHNHDTPNHAELIIVGNEKINHNLGGAPFVEKPIC